jgi:hypothetical protein
MAHALEPQEDDSEQRVDVMTDRVCETEGSGLDPDGRQHVDFLVTDTICGPDVTPEDCEQTVDVLAAATISEMRVTGLPRIAPRWVAPAFGLGVLLLVPWMIYLGFELPEHNLARHWGLTWVGFDAVLAFTMMRTAWLAWKGRRQVEIPAAVTGVLLLVDAWFDVTTAAPGSDLIQALIVALVIEIPIAGVCFYVARNVEHVVGRAQQRILERAAEPVHRAAGSRR